MNVLNLYAGIGGNRKFWHDCKVTAVEYESSIAKVYKQNNPNDDVRVEDAHLFLQDEYIHYDFIWSSPPCQTHSKMAISGRNRTPRYVDLRLYEEIMFLQRYCTDTLWIVENVVPYYKPLIEPTLKVGRHLFWSNIPGLNIDEVKSPKNFIKTGTVQGSSELKNWLGVDYEGNVYYKKNHDPCQVLRNAVHPLIGKQVFDQVKRTIHNLPYNDTWI